jgi:hypothetical protein
VADVADRPERLVVTLRRSKTDQEGGGRGSAPPGSHPENCRYCNKGVTRGRCYRGRSAVRSAEQARRRRRRAPVGKGCRAGGQADLTCELVGGDPTATPATPCGPGCSPLRRLPHARQDLHPRLWHLPDRARDRPFWCRFERRNRPRHDRGAQPLPGRRVQDLRPTPMETSFESTGCRRL